MDTLQRRTFMRALELDFRHAERVCRRERKLAAKVRRNKVRDDAAHAHQVRVDRRRQARVEVVPVAKLVRAEEYNPATKMMRVIA